MCHYCLLAVMAVSMYFFEDGQTSIIWRSWDLLIVEPVACHVIAVDALAVLKGAIQTCPSATVVL